MKLLGGVAAVAFLILSLAPAAQAKTFTVTRADDPAPDRCKPRDCSLREAVLAANRTARKDVVVLPRRRGAYVLQREGTEPEDAGRSGDLDVHRPLAIVHRGKGRATIDAKRIDRILHVHKGGELVLKRLVLRGGRTRADDHDGGAILTYGDLRTVRVSFIGNRALHGSGGAIDSDSDANVRLVRSKFVRNAAEYNGGAFNGDRDGMLVVKRSLFRANHADNDGGALDNGPMRIERSRFIANRAGNDGGGVDYGAAQALSLSDSVLRRNSAAANGGAIYLLSSGTSGPARISRSTLAENEAQRGGGLAVAGTSVQVTSSTFAGNAAESLGGAVFVGVRGYPTLNAVTIARNVAGDVVGGGGIYAASDSTTVVRNSLLALNRANPADPEENDCVVLGLLTSAGHNLSTTWCHLEQSSDLPERANPGLGKLGGHGGPTPTIPLRKGSPAIGKADPQTAPKRDQRGRKRDRKPDIGAFERGA